MAGNETIFNKGGRKLQMQAGVVNLTKIFQQRLGPDFQFRSNDAEILPGQTER